MRAACKEYIPRPFRLIMPRRIWQIPAKGEGGRAPKMLVESACTTPDRILFTIQVKRGSYKEAKPPSYLRRSDFIVP